MARPIWHGAINFGLVTIPVALYSATEDHAIHFRQFERGTSDRIRYRRVNERTGKEVDYNDIVKGHELGDGEYVLLEQEELDEVAPGRSRTIDIDAFVEADGIDPIHFQNSYWLAPSKQEFQRVYTLLLQAMARTNRVGIARFVMRAREYLAAIRPSTRVLTLHTLHFAADIRDPARELDTLPDKPTTRGKELDMAVNLIESMSASWRPEDYQDTYTERVAQLIQDKQAGRTVSVEEQPAEPTNVVDLFDALSRSIKAGRRNDKPAKPKRGRRTPTGEGTDLSRLSKGELDAMARQLGIKGRSTMRRAELEKAVRGAASKPRRAS